MTDEVFARSSIGDVKCIVCSAPMAGIRDPSTRDTCHNCGGHSKIATNKNKRSFESMQRFLRKYPYTKRGRK